MLRFSPYSVDSTPCQVDFVAPLNEEDDTIPTLEHYTPCEVREEQINKRVAVSPSKLRVTSQFSISPRFNDLPMKNSISSDIDPTGSPRLTSDNFKTGELTTQSRHRRSSSQSTSMSNVPDFMVQAQLLSPRGLTATAKLFEDARNSASARLCALRGEEVNFGLGINNVNVLGGSEHWDEDIYEFCHTEEGGGIPVRKEKPKKGGEMRGGDEIDAEGDFVAVDHYHLEDDSSSEDEDNGIAQGGALLDLPTPFPAFDEVAAALLEAAGGVYYTMPVGPIRPGTIEYMEQLSRRRCRVDR